MEVLPPPPSINGNFFNSINAAVPPPTDGFNVLTNKILPSISTKGIGNDLFGFEAAIADHREKKKTKIRQEVDHFLYELPNTIPNLELGDGLLNSLGTTVQNLFDNNAPPFKKKKKKF